MGWIARYAQAVLSSTSAVSSRCRIARSTSMAVASCFGARPFFRPLAQGICAFLCQLVEAHAFFAHHHQLGSTVMRVMREREEALRH